MAGIATSQQVIIESMKSNRVNTAKELAEASGLKKYLVSLVTRKLVKRGLIIRVAHGQFRLTSAGRKHKREGGVIKGSINFTGTHPPARNTFRFRLWNAFRNEDKARTVDQLLEMAANGKENNPHNNAYMYIRALEMSGYVVRMARKVRGPGRTSPGLIRYLLVNDTGPDAPAWRPKRSAIYDPNTGKEIPCLREVGKIPPKAAKKHKTPTQADLNGF
jgi:hypothetical protein